MRAPAAPCRVRKQGNPTKANDNVVSLDAFRKKLLARRVKTGVSMPMRIAA
jgi:hypothetical protein